MNYKRLFAIAASLLVTLSWRPASAQLTEGAKGLYFEQMDQPDKQLNTGIQYWIELNRQGRVWKVNNKFAFKTGDKIRFHVKPNIDGFAYILLRSGSRGERSVLFPEPDEDNKVERGKDYALPRDGYLAFDEHPGLEKVTLVLSRAPMDAVSYLETDKGQQRTLIASAAEGAKDLIPSKILLSYTPVPPLNPPAPVALTRPAKPVEPVKEKTAQTAQPAARTTGRKPPAAARRRATRARPAEPPVMPEAPAQQKPAPTTTQLAEQAGNQEIVTVVYNEPNGVLALDIDLEHM